LLDGVFLVARRLQVTEVALLDGGCEIVQVDVFDNEDGEFLTSFASPGRKNGSDPGPNAGKHGLRNGRIDSSTLGQPQHTSGSRSLFHRMGPP